MSFDTFIEDTMDDAMMAYTDRDDYKSKQAEINSMITNFRDSLTSKEQRTEFNRIIDMINTMDADFSANAYVSGFKTGKAFQDTDLER